MSVAYLRVSVVSKDHGVLVKPISKDSRMFLCDGNSDIIEVCSKQYNQHLSVLILPKSTAEVKIFAFNVLFVGPIKVDNIQQVNKPDQCFGSKDSTFP